MKFSLEKCIAATAFVASVGAFVPIVPQMSPSRVSSSSLYAIGALARKAKEATLRKYIADGIEDSVMEKYNIIKDALTNDTIDLSSSPPAPLQDTLTRRKGTITVIAEYKRKLAGSGSISDIAFDPELLSPEFREFGASGIAVMADERMGGCTYEDIKKFAEEQRRAGMSVPGPVIVINNDLIIDEIQVAQTAAYGAGAAVLSLELLGEEETTKLMKACLAVKLEIIVAVSTKEEAQKAVDLGARMLSVVNMPGIENKVAVIEGLNIPKERPVTMIANILSRNNKGLEEVEEAWACRDKGFSCVWVSDVLYKLGNDVIEHPGSIIKSMTAKSSLKWASPTARSGKGEGAREYLGDILM
jgi:indole-3-glycerol phosphate synthase